MEKRIALPVMAMAIIGVALGSVAFAQSAVPSLGNPLIGKGLAVSVADPNTFKAVSIGITERNMPRGNTTTSFKGTLNFGGEKLKVTNVALSGTTVTASLERNGTVVGSVSLTPTNDANHWTGPLVLDGQPYNLFIVSMPHGFGRVSEKMKNHFNKGRHAHDGRMGAASDDD